MSSPENSPGHEGPATHLNGPSSSPSSRPTPTGDLVGSHTRRPLKLRATSTYFFLLWIKLKDPFPQGFEQSLLFLRVRFEFPIFKPSFVPKVLFGSFIRPIRHPRFSSYVDPLCQPGSYRTWTDRVCVGIGGPG